MHFFNNLPEIFINCAKSSDCMFLEDYSQTEMYKKKHVRAEDLIQLIHL